MIVPIKKKNISYKIADELMKNIINGTWKQGERLPSERSMSEEFQVSRTSVREAVKMLCSSKILESRPGAGTYVVNTPSAVLPAGEVQAKCDDPLMRALEMRMIMEPSIARLVAIYANEQEIDSLNKMCDEIEHAFSIGDMSLYSFSELKFHRFFFLLSGNPDLSETMNQYSGSPQHIALMEREPDQWGKASLQHRELVRACRQHDADLAEKIMCEHIMYAFNVAAREMPEEEKNDFRIRLLARRNLDDE